MTGAGSLIGGSRHWLRTLVVCICAAVCAIWATVPAPADEAPRDDRLQEIRDRGRLIVGVKTDYQPFGFRDATGALVGYDVDVARAFAQTIGVEAELVPVTSANRLQMLQRGEIDLLVATLGDTRSRRELVAMVEPQYYGDGANVLLRPDARTEDWADLRGRTLCGVQGSLWNRLAHERLLVDVVAFNSTREVKSALRDGHCAGWLFDEVNLLHEIESGEWEGYHLSLPTRFVGPWAVAIASQEAGGRLDILLGDTVAGWHRDGFLQALEKRWDLPPSPYLRRARETWAASDETGAPVCRREADGQWPLACREVALITSQEAGGVSGLSLTLLEATGLDVSILYDPFDRDVFLLGLVLTVALSVTTVAASVGLGIVFGWLIHRRVRVVAPAVKAFCAVLRMTPPLLQLYLVFFGLGSVVLTLGLSLDAFAVCAVVLSLYAASGNAVAFALAADVAAGNGPPLRFVPADLLRAKTLCYAAVMGNSVNIVKATGMASTLAIPELVHASTTIVAEKGNADVMMNLLLLCYFVLVLVTVRLFRRLEHRSAGL